MRSPYRNGAEVLCRESPVEGRSVPRFHSTSTTNPPRGGFVVDVEWKRGTLLPSTGDSRHRTSAPFRYGDRIREIAFEPGMRVQLHPESFKQKQKNAGDTH